MGMWYLTTPDIRMSRRVEDAVLRAGILIAWWEEFDRSECWAECDPFMRMKRAKLLFVWAEVDYFWSMACRECDARYDLMEVWETSEEKFMEDDVAEVKRIMGKIHRESRKGVDSRRGVCSNFNKFIDLLISG